MTEGGRRDGGRGSWMVPLSQAVAVATGMALLAMMACDTVARIPTEDRTFRALHPVTITPHDAGEEGCGALGNSQPSTMSMVFLDNDREPIKPGQDIERVEVDSSAVDIEFESGNLYSIPDVECEDSTNCTGLLTCLDVSGVDARRCHESTGVTVMGEPEFVGNEPASQAIGVAVADVGRWGGRYHEDFLGLYELNEDGENRELEQPRDDDVATDRGSNRILALSDLAGEWGRLSDYVVNRERDAYFGYWLFGGPSAEVSSQLPGGDWTQDPGTADDAVDVHPFQEGRAGVYNSMIRIIQDAFAGDQIIADVEEKHLIFLVAGYDERRDNPVDEVIDLARTHDVAVSVVHVDGEIPEPEYLRDDERYYRDQYDTPCADESECANYEACREPTIYVDDASTDDPDEAVWPNLEFHTPGNRYCLPDYDENGRVGPIEDYQRLACATGGSYSYVPEVQRSPIAQPLIAQLWASEAAWEVDIDINEHPAETEGGEAYLLETTLDVTIGRNQTFRFDIGEGADYDTREAFFTEE